MLNSKRLSFKIGLLLAIIHLLLFILTYIDMALAIGVYRFPPIIFYLDIFLLPLFKLLKPLLSPLICSDSLAFNLMLILFGILGTLCWFYIPMGVAKGIKKFTRPKVKEQFK